MTTGTEVSARPVSLRGSRSERDQPERRRNSCTSCFSHEGSDYPPQSQRAQPRFGL